MIQVHKFFDDFYCSNLFLAKVAGLSLQELNYLEIAFLSVLDFAVFISETEFMNYEGGLINFINQTPSGGNLDDMI